MTKLNQLFIRSFVIIVVFITISSSVAVYMWFENIYLKQVETNLSQNIDSLILSAKSSDDFANFVDGFKSKTGVRTTIITDEGVVIAESDKDIDDMDNHKNREEILQLKSSDIGFSIRVSDTTGKKHLYVVKKATIGDREYFVRMAQDIDRIEEKFLTLSLQIVAIFLVSLLIAFFLFFRIGRLIKKETYSIEDMLNRLLEKRSIDEEKESKIYEFYTISYLLSRVGKKLKTRQKQKSKQAAKLKLANLQKDDIISALSHEFKNPIAIIKGYCETLQKDEVNKEIESRFLSKIEKNANKMNDMLDRLRLSLKLEDGKYALNFEKTDMKALIEDIIGEFASSHGDREILFEGSSVHMEIDRLLFSIALGNIIENALKYSEGKIEIELKEESLSIKDSGIGLEKSDIKKVTQKFYRVSQNSWNNSLGLGLNITYNVIKLHNFKLEIDSEKNVGSTFKILF